MGQSLGLPFTAGLSGERCCGRRGGCPSSRTLPGAARASAPGQARGLTPAPNAPGSPVAVGLQRWASAGWEKRLPPPERRNGRDGSGARRGQGERRCRERQQQPSPARFGEQRGFVLPRIKRYQERLEPQLPAAGQRLAEERRTSAEEGKDVQAATQGGGTRVKRSQGSHLSSPFAGSLLSHTPWASAIKTQAQASKPPPQLQGHGRQHHAGFRRFLRCPAWEGTVRRCRLPACLPLPAPCKLFLRHQRLKAAQNVIFPARGAAGMLPWMGRSRSRQQHGLLAAGENICRWEAGPFFLCKPRRFPQPARHSSLLPNPSVPWPARPESLSATLRHRARQQECAEHGQTGGWDNHIPHPPDPCTPEPLQDRTPAPPDPCHPAFGRGKPPGQESAAGLAVQRAADGVIPDVGVPHPNFSPFLHADGVTGGQLLSSLAVSNLCR